MTNNQLQREANEIKREELSEKKRSNRAKERIDRFGKATGALKDVGSFAKGITPLAGFINDVSWYTTDKTLAENVSKFPFGAPLGTKYVRKGMKEGASTGTRIERFPALMSLNYVPVLGSSKDAAGKMSIPTLAAQSIYTFVRHANSGHSNYERNDLMMAILAMDNAILAIAELQRMYGACRYFDSNNREVPAQFFVHYGLKWEDVSKQLPYLRTQINMLIAKLSTIAIPAKMPLINRHVWMSSCLFKDGNIKKAQAYFFKPTHLYQYNETVTPGKLTPAPWDGKFGISGLNPSLQGYINLANDLVNRLLNSEDIGIISGDILKAYGDEGIWKLQSLNEDYMLQVVYSEEVLLQIRNATLFGAGTGFTVPEIVQNGSNIEQEMLVNQIGTPVEPTSNYWILKEGDERQLIAYTDTPTSDDVLVATRLMALWDQSFDAISSNSTSVMRRHLLTSGTEVVLYAAIARFDEDTGNTYELNTYVDGMKWSTFKYTSSPKHAVFAALDRMSDWMKFDWAPNLTLYNEVTAATTGPKYQYYPVISLNDVANNTLVNVADITPINEVCCLSEYGVNYLGNKNRR